jgi:hypothetical protein
LYADRTHPKRYVVDRYAKHPFAETNIEPVGPGSPRRIGVGVGSLEIELASTSVNVPPSPE